MWVPRSSVSQVLHIVERGYGQVWTEESHACKQTLAKVMIPVQLNGTELMGLVDSESGHILVQDALVPKPEALRETIFLHCIHRDIKPYPSACVQLMVGENTKFLVVGGVSTLAYPNIVGWDCISLKYRGGLNQHQKE